jgi:hypothetical protein
MPETAPVFLGSVDRGRLVLDDPSRFHAHLRGLDKKRVEVVVRRQRRIRSLDQNRYYWGVVVKMLADGFGYEPEEMHEALKFQFLRVPSAEGRPLETVRSTASLSTVEFMDYIAAVQRWAAAEYCICIPDPGQVDFY